MRQGLDQRARLLRYVHDRGVCSRRDIARDLGLTAPMVSGLARDLFIQGALKEAGMDPSAGGRRPARITLDPACAFAIGVHVGRRRIRCALADASGGIVEERADAEAGAAAHDAAASVIVRMVNELASRPEAARLAGVALAVSGVIRPGGRIARDFPDGARWSDAPLADAVERGCGRRPLLVNDVHAAALAELRLGGWAPVKDLVLLHLGDGIAAGIVIGGRLYCGSGANAGEIGHNLIGDGGDLCYCGNRGCLENVASPRAVVESCRRALARGVRTQALDLAGAEDALRFDHLLAAAEHGDRLATTLIEEAGRTLGSAAANLINIFDPQALVLGGLLAAPGGLLADTVERSARARVLPLLQAAVRIERSRLKDAAPVVGAAALVIDDLLGDPAKLVARGILRAS